MDKIVEKVWVRKPTFKYEIYFLYEDGTWELILECDSRDHTIKGSFSNVNKKTRSQVIEQAKKVVHTKEWNNPWPGHYDQTYHEYKAYY